MKVYYMVSQVDREGKIYCYELDLIHSSHVLTLYFIDSHPPIKRLSKKKPIQFFGLKKTSLKICLSTSLEKGYLTEGNYLTNPDFQTLASHIEQAMIRTNISGIGVKEGLDKIAAEFLKALYTE